MSARPSSFEIGRQQRIPFSSWVWSTWRVFKTFVAIVVGKLWGRQVTPAYLTQLPYTSGVTTAACLKWTRRLHCPQPPSPRPLIPSTQRRSRRVRILSPSWRQSGCGWGQPRRLFLQAWTPQSVRRWTHCQTTWSALKRSLSAHSAATGATPVMS